MAIIQSRPQHLPHVPPHPLRRRQTTPDRRSRSPPPPPLLRHQPAPPTRHQRRTEPGQRSTELHRRSKPSAPATHHPPPTLPTTPTAACERHRTPFNDNATGTNASPQERRRSLHLPPSASDPSTHAPPSLEPRTRPLQRRRHVHGTVSHGRLRRAMGS